MSYFVVLRCVLFYSLLVTRCNALCCFFLLLETTSGKELVITGVFIEFASELVHKAID